MILLKSIQKFNSLTRSNFKNQIHLSFSRNFNKIRNPSNLIKHDKCLLPKRSKTTATIISFTLIPFLPTVYARDAGEQDLIIKAKPDENDKEELKEDKSNKIDQSSFTWQELWKLVKPHFLYLFISVMGSLAIAYLNIKIPISLGELTNELSKYVKDTQIDVNDFLSSIKAPAIRLIWSYILQGAFSTITINALSTLGENIAVDLRMQLFKSLINQDIEFFDKKRVGDIMNVLTTDIQEFKSSFKLFFSQGLRSFTQSIGCTISLYLISPKMSIFLSVLVPNIVFTGYLIGKILRQISKECQDQAAKLNAIANEVISSMRTIKACAMEDKEIKIFDDEVKELSNLNKKLGVGIAIFQGLTNVALNGIVLSCMFVGGYLLSSNEIEPGDLMAFLVAAQTIQRSLASLSLMTGSYIKFINTGNRIFDFISMEPSLVSGKQQLDPLIGEINFRKVNFAYPTRKEHKVFDNFSLKINPGQTFALVGHSDAGKSSLAMLLERFYDVDSGSIRIDGVDIKELDLNWLRSKNIGYINQEPTLFHTSIIENIRYSCPKSSDEDVINAAKMAYAHDFISRFPQGYETVVGERGVTLSGGQKQRIVIAREILKNPRILILDESTSNLDSESEKLISDALAKLMKGKTCLIIAHRLSTVKSADLIAVISNGKIQELGNHHELFNLKGLYYQLIKQQQSSN